MLVLSRRPNEEIIINDGKIRIVVVKISKDQVKLGIDAPKDVIVDRGEIHDIRTQQTFTSQDTRHDITLEKHITLEKPAEDKVQLG